MAGPSFFIYDKLMRLSFYGGVKEVTGANYLIEEGPSAGSGQAKILIDCGLKQGGAYTEKQNWEPFPYNPAEIRAVFITHSHIDHIGRLPALLKAGFKGKIYSTPPTRDAAELLLLDSEHLLSQEAERFHLPPLYAADDAAKLMGLWEGVNYHQKIEVESGKLEVRFYNAGHILGSSFVVAEGLETNPETSSGQGLGRRIRVAFSGDLGNSPAPLIGMKENLPDVDYCLIESTYGGRIHEDLQQRKEIIEDLIEDTAKNNGVLMIPAFAMERTQELLFEINQLQEQKRVPSMPIFLDSPLAIKLTETYKKHRNYLIEGKFSMDFPLLKKTLTTEESKSINNAPPPKVIIAGSGMSHGGRILHHEKRYLPDPNSTLLIIGYQASGSLGRRILDGEKTVKIHGEAVAINCRVKAIGGYSAHADQPQLLSWLKSQKQNFKKIFVVQGEEDQSAALTQKIKDELAVEAEIPEIGKEYML